MTIHILVLSLIATIYANEHPLNWYTTPSVSNFPISKVDFRGCYESQCIYVSNAPLHSTDKFLSHYQPTTSSERNLWVLGVRESSSLNATIQWVFSSQRPEESPNTLWISRVPNFRIVPSKFDKSRYLTADPDPLVVKIVESISEENIRGYVTQLANGFYTRNTFSEDAIDAARFLEGKMTELGCLSARLHPYRTGYAPNVICELTGSDSDAPIVVVGAHYDSRGTSANSPTDRAPGADDNGSGTSGLLEILRAIVGLRTEGNSFRRTIVFMLFSGEEQGLYGSEAMAAEFKNNDVEIEAMINLDMIGFPQRNAPTTLYWKALHVNQDLTALGISLTRTYLGESTIIAESVSCCSDFQSFTEQGYAATGVFESTSGTNNPNYHKASDLPDTVVYSHARRTTQMAAALIATVAEPSDSKL